MVTLYHKAFCVILVLIMVEMNAWQIFLIGYLVVGIGIAITLFRFRRTYQPLRTRFTPSVVASFLSGMFWGVALPLIAMRLIFHRNRVG